LVAGAQDDEAARVLRARLVLP